MKATLETESATDERLVLSSRNGDREAFARIVERYQSLICALTYGACGDLQTSEDLAQMTFITAWSELPKLQEPSKLKSWLCGIARNVANSSFRQQRHTPTANAEDMDATAIPSEAPSPRDHVITKEEETILWRALSDLPATYREPLALFYRQHQSTAEVAEVLGLSEDAVHQRLSRGRAMLTERVAQFVETALTNTGPTKTFTVAVLAGLPLAATTAKAAVVGVAATKTGATAKTASWLGALGAILTAGVLFVFSFFAFLLFTGGCIGYVMSRASQRSSRQREYVSRFWRMLAAGFLVVAVPGLLGMPWGVVLIYPLALAALAVWVWRWRRALSHSGTDTKASATPSNKTFFVWLGLGMIVPVLVFLFFVVGMVQEPLTNQRLSSAEAQELIATRSDATILLEQYKGAPKRIWIRLPENSRRIEYWAPADESTVAVLTKSGHTHQTIEFRDPGLAKRWLPLLSMFVVPIGGVMLLRRPWRRDFYGQEVEVRKSETVAARAFAVCVALAMIAAAGHVGLITRWHVRTLSSAEAQKIILDNKDALILLAQYKNGSRDLEITLPGSQRRPNFIAPADDPTLALLAEKGIPYLTMIQGPDFGFGTPVPRYSLLCMVLLVVGAGVLFVWAWKNRVVPPAPARNV